MVIHEDCFFPVLEMNITAATKFAIFSDSSFIMNYDLNIDMRLDRSVKGLPKF